MSKSMVSCVRFTSTLEASSKVSAAFQPGVGVGVGVGGIGVGVNVGVNVEVIVGVNEGVNDGDNEDCPIESFGQREDDNGHLDIYFQLDDLKNCKGDLEINSESNILRIEGVDTDETTFCGESDMHIVGKQGPGKS